MSYIVAMNEKLCYLCIKENYSSGIDIHFVGGMGDKQGFRFTWPAIKHRPFILVKLYYNTSSTRMKQIDFQMQQSSHTWMHALYYDIAHLPANQCRAFDLDILSLM